MFYYISETNEIHTYIYQNIRNILTSTQPTSYCSVIFRKLCNWCLIFQMKIYFSPDGYQSYLQCQNTYNKYIILLRNRITIRICVHLNQIGWSKCIIFHSTYTNKSMCTTCNNIHRIQYISLWSFAFDASILHRLNCLMQYQPLVYITEKW